MCGGGGGESCCCILCAFLSLSLNQSTSYYDDELSLINFLYIFTAPPPDGWISNVRAFFEKSQKQCKESRCLTK